MNQLAMRCALTCCCLTAMLLAPLQLSAQQKAKGKGQDTTEARETFTPKPAMRVETLTAYTRPVVAMQVSSEVSGRVLEVFADVGQQIASDAKFATVDDTFVRLDLEAQKVERQRLESRRDYYQKETKRYRNLVAGRHADQSTLDKFEQDLEQALLQLSSVDVAIRRLQEQLERHTVRAPAGFTVMERQVEPGEWVTAGQMLAELGDFRTLVAPFALDPQQYQWLRENTHALKLNGQGLHGQGLVPLTAWLHQVSPGFDPQTRKINVELAFHSKTLEARGGVRVQLDIPLPDRSGAMLVPASSVSTRYEQHWLTRPDGSRLDVVLLGTEPDGRLRVQAPELDATRRFLLNPDARAATNDDNKGN